MKPAPFEYFRAASLEEALAALRQHSEAAVLAGGQSLLAMMNMRVARPTHLVDISHVAELAGVTVTDGRLRIGALVRHAELESSPVVASAAPLLAMAAAELAHPAIRNRGAIGGSLALADPAAELPACVLALDGSIEIAGEQGRRTVPASGFFLGAYETALRAGEVLTAVELPAAAGARSAYVKLARRHGDYAQVGLAAQGVNDGGMLHDLRLAYFAVEARPVLAVRAAAALAGTSGGSDALERAATALADDLTPVDHPECGARTKLHLAGVALRRAVAQLLA